ncbi:MAG: cytochrome c-type biogenesis protein CcmH [Gammaproteobacteria bacterium]|nr:cytochrome c-type biogenesis protein CcmH [Gammaproteobacteria bacterium]
MKSRLSALFAGLLLPTLLVFGLAADEPLADPAQQALYERLANEVRCLVCQNQTIADSNAPLAADLRREIRQKVLDGQSESEIKVFLTDRYGDFVLYRPRFGGPSLLLWLAPAVLLLFGIVVLWKIIRRRSTLPVSSEAEDAIVDSD